jgi:phosphatidylglycerol:prolipoprotein diacylglycerol transferase
MLPTLFKIGPIPIHSYGLMMAIGFLTALYLARRDAPRFGLDPDRLSDMAFWLLLLGLSGTRVLYIIMFRHEFSWTQPVEWIAIWKGGLVFQGAIPPALAVLYYYARRYNMGFWNLLDVVAPYAALGHAIGRIGCFLNGCCYGQRTDLPWGVSFPRIPFGTSEPFAFDGSPVYIDHAQRYHFDTSVDQWSYPVHPTQLYSAVGLTMLFFVLIYLRNHWRPFHGSIFTLYFMLYGVFRFFLEMIRGDHNPTHFFNLTDQQIFSIIAFVVAAFLFVALRRAKVGETPAPTDPS